MVIMQSIVKTHSQQMKRKNGNLKGNFASLHFNFLIYLLLCFRLSNLNSIGVKRKRILQSSNEEVTQSDLKKSKVNHNDDDSDSIMSLSLSLDGDNENNKTDLSVEKNHLEIPMEYDCVEPLEEQEQTNLPTVESDFDSDLIKDSDEENVNKSNKKEKLNQDENKENEPIKEPEEVSLLFPT